MGEANNVNKFLQKQLHPIVVGLLAAIFTAGTLFSEFTML